MGLRGHVKFEVRDSKGKLKLHIDKNNHITELGKAAALFYGVSSLVIPSDVYSGYTVPDDNGRPATSGSTYSQKDSTAIVECDLLDKPASDLADACWLEPTSDELTAFGKNTTASGSLTTKEGLRVVPTDMTTGAKIAASAAGNKITTQYQFTNISGDVQTIAMRIPKIALVHNLPDMFNNDNEFIPSLLAGTTARQIAVGGASYNKALNLDTLAITDFVPTDTFTPNKCFGAIEYNGFILEGSYNSLRVTEIATGTTYTENWTGIRGLFETSTNAYILCYNSYWRLYEITSVSDTETQTTEVNWYTVIGTNDLCPSSSIPTNYYLTSFRQGDQILYFAHDVEFTSGMVTTYGMIIFDDLNKNMNDSSNYRLETDSYAASDIYWCNYRGLLIHYGYYTYSEVLTGDQIGNLFSYFDLEQTYTLEATDIVTVTYTYELEEAV